ncbi:hypothetical protein GC207_10675 [bacterium]|nr:hypothetical protein [bacterium]
MAIYDTVLHPTDFRPEAQNAFAHALRIAVASHGLLNVIHVGDFKKGVSWEAFPHVRPMLTRWGFLPARATLKEMHELGIGVKKVELGAESTANLVAGYIVENGPSLVVIATHQRRGIDRLLHASISEKVARRTHARTLFVPQGVDGFVRTATGEITLRRVLVPLKLGLAPQFAVDEAVRIVRLLDCHDVRFTLLHIGSKYAMPRVHIASEHNWKVDRVCAAGVVEEQIVKAARSHRADLIVMVTQGHAGFLDAVRGNSTERVLHDAPCPVLAIPKHRRV